MQTHVIQAFKSEKSIINRICMLVIKIVRASPGFV